MSRSRERLSLAERESIRRLFAEALVMDEAEREAFVQRAAADRSRVAEEVLSLLAVSKALDEQDEAGECEPDASTWGLPLHLLGRPKPARDESGRRITRYDVVRPIGAGGFGVVYEAKQFEPVRRTVALKVIKPGMDTSEVVARFEAERQALALMDHPNVARVFDGGATDDGRPFFVMEFVHGVPLTDHCDEARLGVTERLQLFLKVCDAVQHAHTKGVIHRDIKPSNILVEHDSGEPKVIDFGVAKAIEQRLSEETLMTMDGQLIGTPEYMSPEQTDTMGADIDTRADVYALGVVLYELLTGLLPHDMSKARTGGVDALRRIVREIDPPRPSSRVTAVRRATASEAEQLGRHRRVEAASLAARLRGDLDWIVMRCLAKDRDRRYGSAAALAADLRRHLADQPVLAGPPSARYQVRKFVKRHRTGVAVAALLAAVLLTATTVSTSFAVASVRERTRAASARDAAEAAAYAAQLNLLADAVFEMRNPASNALFNTIDWPGDPWERRYLEARRDPFLWTNSIDDQFAELDAVVDDDGTTLAATTFSGRLLLLDPTDGSILREASLLPPHDPGRALWNNVALSPFDEFIVFDNRGNLTLASLASLEPIETVQLDGLPYRAAYSEPLDSFVILLRGDRLVRLARSGDRRPIEIARVPGAQTFTLDSSGEVGLALSRYQTPPRRIDLVTGEVTTIDVPIADQAVPTDRPGVFLGAMTDAHADVSGVALLCTNTNRLLDAYVHLPDNAVGGMAVGPDFRTAIFTRAALDSVYAIDLTRRAAPRPLGVHKDRQVRGLTFVDDRVCVSISAAGSIIARDTRSRLGVASTRSPGACLREAEITPDENAFYTYDWESTLLQRRSAADGSLVQSFTLDGFRQGDRWSDLAIAPCGSWAVALSQRQHVVRWCATSHEVTHTFRPPGDSAWSWHRRSLAIHPDGDRVVAPGLDGFDIWDAEGRLLQHVPLPEGFNIAIAAAFSPDGRSLALGWGAPGERGRVDILDVRTAAHLATDGDLDRHPFALQFSPDSRSLAVGTWIGGSWLFDLSTGERTMLVAGDRERIWQFRFTPDGERLIAGAGGHEILVWDAHTGKRLMSIPTEPSIYADILVDITASGDLVVVYGNTAEVHSIDARSISDTGG